MQSMSTDEKGVFMTVGELLRECRNGVKVEIEEHVYFAEGDSQSVVFEGVVGTFGKTGYEKEEISYVSVRSDALLIVTSRVE